ncbi:MAG: glycosyltransferase family 9 protein [Candidatus Obscuribacter sp.]|nr:glycosyltransferase family 9 protein [Candidatus Obscuribacter sp.]
MAGIKAGARSFLLVPSTLTSPLLATGWALKVVQSNSQADQIFIIDRLIRSMVRILLVKLSAIGDVIHCLPAAARLKQILPDCQLHWLVEAPASPILLGNPVVDKVIILPKKEWKAGLKQFYKPSAVLPAMASIAEFINGLKQNQYDLAIDAQGLLKSALLARYSGAKKVVGFAGTREFAERFLTDALDIGDYFGGSRHIVDLNIELAEFGARVAGVTAAGIEHHTVVCFPLPEPGLEERQRVEQTLALPGSSTAPHLPPPPLAIKESGDKDEAPLIALIPGTTWATKIWDASSWIGLGVRLIKEQKARLIILGGPADKTLNDHIYKGIQNALVSDAALPQNDPASILDLTASTSFIELIALFGHCHLVVGADTGPLHLASATQKTKVLSVHGASPWLRNGPYGPGGASVHLDLDCQPCFAKTCRLGTIACLKDLPIEKVFQACMQLLGQPIIR